MRTHPFDLSLTPNLKPDVRLNLKPNLVLTVACLLAVVLFLLDAAVPEAHLWTRYLLPIIVTFLWGRRRDIYVATALAGMLVAAGCWFDRPLGLADLLADYLLPILILWGAAWLLAQRQLLLQLLARQEQDFDDQVTTRTAALAAREQILQAANAELEQRVAAHTAALETALAELQHASKLKDEFMAMISHELRTPLMGVLSLSEMLEDQVAGPLNDRQAIYIKGIIRSGERLLTAVNNILSYTQLIAGQVRLRAEPCTVANLLDIGVAAEHGKAAAKDQAIAVQIEPPELAITGDANAINEVLTRLLDNAVKFTPAGGQIGLAAHPGVSSGTVDLVVWDTGIGIAADEVGRVFNAFTQVDGRLTRSHEGFGLGLAYVDKMVRLMGGTIALTSMPGRGSRFTVTLPARLSA